MKRELAPGLILEKRSAALGVVLVIFEARPEALPQIAALALRAGRAGNHTSAVPSRWRVPEDLQDGGAGVFLNASSKVLGEI